MADLPAYLAPTFAERRAARLAAEKKAPEPDVKQVDDTADEVEDKAVKPAETKKRVATRKKS